MRTSSSFCLSTYFLITLLRVINAITLSQWQPITGFSQACVNAYNTPLTGCTASDFEQGSCSTTCISFLEALTNILNAECGGTSAYPNTLIGAFFRDDGTSVLCRNVLGSSGDNNYVFTTGVGEANTYTLEPYTSTSVAAPSSLTSSTLPLLSAAPTSSTSLTTVTTSSASIAATTTRVAIVDTTIAPNTLTSVPSPVSTSHVHEHASSTSTSSTSTKTSSGGDNGGGSPLDVGSSSSATYNSRIGVGAIGFIFGFTGLMLSL